jgi:toxin ParE1/3/4
VSTEAATRDVDEIWSYIADDSIESADRVVDSIYEEILRVGSSPAIGHKRPDLGMWRPITFWAAGRYLIAYRTSVDETVILAVLHGSRDIPAVLREREDAE